MTRPRISNKKRWFAQTRGVKTRKWLARQRPETNKQLFEYQQGLIDTIEFLAKFATTVSFVSYES